MYLHTHFHDEREFHHCFSSCFHNYFLRCHSSKTFLYWRNRKILISLKRHTSSIKCYLFKNYLHKKFILTYIWITKLMKKNYFEKFLWEIDFVELHTQTKHLRVWILLDDLMIAYDIIDSFYILNLLQYDRIFHKRFGYDINGVK